MRASRDQCTGFRTRSILTEGCGAFVVPENEETFAQATLQALEVKADDPRRAQLLTHAESWASQAMARRLMEFYEKVRKAAPARDPLPLTPSST